MFYKEYKFLVSKDRNNFRLSHDKKYRHTTYIQTYIKRGKKIKKQNNANNYSMQQRTHKNLKPSKTGNISYSP